MLAMPLEQVVTRWVAEPVRPVETALAGDDVLRVDGGFSQSCSNGHRTWTVHGRLPALRRARVEVQVTQWAPELTEVSVRPTSRRVLTWGARYERKYFERAHAAAAHVAERLRAA